MLFDWKQTSNFSLNFQYILYSHPLCALLCFVQLRVLFQYFVHQQGFYFQGFDRSLSFYSAYLVTGHNVSHLKHFLITVLSFDVQETTSRTKKTEADIYSMFLPKEIKRLCFVKCTWSHSFIYAITCLSFETSLISNRIHGERKALKCISFSHYLVSTNPSSVKTVLTFSQPSNSSSGQSWPSLAAAFEFPHYQLSFLQPKLSQHFLEAMTVTPTQTSSCCPVRDI